MKLVSSKSKKLSSDIRSQLRKENIRYNNFNTDLKNIEIDFINDDNYEQQRK